MAITAWILKTALDAEALENTTIEVLDPNTYDGGLPIIPRARVTKSVTFVTPGFGRRHKVVLGLLGTSCKIELRSSHTSEYSLTPLEEAPHTAKNTGCWDFTPYFM